jgi:polysaccharide biosynthesis transport protein
LIPPQYTAKAQIVFQPQGNLDEEARSSIGQTEQETDFQTHITALSSRTFLREVLDSLPHRDEPQSDRAQPSKAGGLKAREARLDNFVRHLHVYQEGGSHVIAVDFSSASPDEAARTANRIAQLYIERDAKRKRAEVSRSLNWIETRFPTARAAFERTQLSREAAAAGQVYANLLQRREQLHSQLEMTTSDFRLLSLALPPNRPSSANLPLLLPPFLIVLMIAASFIAVALERLDQRFHSAREVNDELGIPCIGLVPYIHGNGTWRPHEYLMRNRFAASRKRSDLWSRCFK